MHRRDRLLAGPLLAALTLIALASSGCSSRDSDNGPPDGGGNPTLQAGLALYAADCAACHGSAGQGTGLGPDIRGSGDIASVVRAGTGSMPAFASFTDDQIASLELALASFGSGGPETRTGSELYVARCQSCHGAAGEGVVGSGPGIWGTTGITAVVRNGRGTMPAYPSLSDAQVASLESLLSGFTVPRTGRNLYMRYCTVCHGDDGRGTARYPKNIRNEMDELSEVLREGEDGMPRFEFLGSSDASLIRNYLQSVP